MMVKYNPEQLKTGVCFLRQVGQYVNLLEFLDGRVKIMLIEMLIVHMTTLIRPLNTLSKYIFLTELRKCKDH